MRRADRLFRIVQLLRRDTATTAARLAAELEVSERTIYRDVQDLMASGVPIQGEAGVGYALPRHFDLPPLMFDPGEIAALALGARMVQGWADAELARSARTALAKIENVLPSALADQIARSRLFVPEFHVEAGQRETLRAVRDALDRRCVVELTYRDGRGATTRREAQPLGLFYWGRTWTLTAWCELRSDFRSFRLDRIEHVAVTDRTFRDEPGRRIEDFLASVESEARPTKSDRASGGPPEQPITKRSVRQRAARDRPPRDPVERAAWRGFQRLGSVGPACAHDLILLGFRSADELAGQDPVVLYERLCELTGQRQDPCVEDALRCAIAQVEHPDLPPAWRQWFRWTPLRGKPAGALPAALRRRCR
ncbi:MAG: WYL domain-containing protein [Planctomycetes bacterium]|nr:WYL domain-containing protein [Planctomycetota bacterium]